MKLTLETYRKKYTVETEYDNLTIDEYLDLIKDLLLMATFSEKTINKAIIEFAEQLEDN